MKDKGTSAQSMAKGMAWMTVANIFSRILAAIYIIPWYGWFGSNKLQANAMYTKGFTIYSVFLMLSTVGIPAAISKQIANYDALGEYKLSLRLYRIALGFMLLLGIIMGAIMWGISPLLAAGESKMIPVYHSLSIAVVLMPSMSVSRGFFQGKQDMMPSALSQLMEQLVRIIYMLAATFLIMKVLLGSYTSAVVQSTFASFIGALGGILVLVIIAIKRRKKFEGLSEKSANQVTRSNRQLLIELIRQAIPFAFVGVATSLYAVIDQYTFPNAMKISTNFSEAQINSIYSLFAGNANKLVMIVISLGTAMASTVIPMLSEAVTNRAYREINNRVRNAFKLLLFIVFPSALGMTAVAHQLYVIFYGYSSYNHYGILILKVAATLAIFQAIFLLLVDMIQGLYRNWFAVKYTIFGIIAKLVVQYPLIFAFKGYGPLISTAIGMTVSVTFGISYLAKEFGVSIKKIVSDAAQLLAATIVMYIFLELENYLLLMLFSNSRLVNLIELILLIVTGVIIYGFFILKYGWMDSILGFRVTSIKNKFHL